MPDCATYYAFFTSTRSSFFSLLPSLVYVFPFSASFSFLFASVSLSRFYVSSELVGCLEGGYA